MLITARVKGAPRLDDGVIGHARSADMVHWELGPPISQPAGFGQIEVPQARLVDGRPTLVFTCHTDEQTAQRKEQSGLYCTWSVSGDSLTGPWDLEHGPALPGRAGPVRGAVRAGSVGSLEPGRFRQPGTQGHQLLRHHRPDPGRRCRTASWPPRLATNRSVRRCSPARRRPIARLSLMAN